MLVARTHNYRIELFGGSILKESSIILKMGNKREFFYSLWPIQTNGVASVTQGHRFSTVLVALYSNIFCGITTSYQQEVLVNKLIRPFKIVCVNYSAREVFNSFEIRHIRCGKMSRCHNQIIKFLGIGFIDFQIVQDDCKLLCLFVIIYPSCRSVKTDIIPGLTLFYPSLDIIEQYRSGRIGRYGFFKMFVKRIIRKL